MNEEAIRAHLTRLLDWEEAHVGFDRAVDGILADRRGARPAGFEHSAWQLVEHMRLAQADIYAFCVDAHYKHEMTWPDDYWPDPVPPSDTAWTDSIASFIACRAQMQALARDTVELTAKVPTGHAQHTYLRAILLVADHTAYHVGQLVALRRALGIWP